MMEFDAAIVADDEIGRSVLRRLIREFAPHLGRFFDAPIRGGQIKSLAPKFNKLAEQRTVLLLADQDEHDCPIALMRAYLGGLPHTSGLIFRVAFNEVELWLLADRENLAEYLGVDVHLMPECVERQIQGKVNREIRLGYKASLFIMRDLAPAIRNEMLRRSLLPVKSASKGPDYNGVLLPFVREKWNPQLAAKNSTSLARAIARISAL